MKYYNDTPNFLSYVPFTSLFTDRVPLTTYYNRVGEDPPQTVIGVTLKEGVHDSRDEVLCRSFFGQCLLVYNILRQCTLQILSV